MSEPVSFQMAIKHGFSRGDDGKYRPPVDSDFVEKLGHDKSHTAQCYLYPANKPDTLAGICGGREFTLADMAFALGIDLKSIGNGTPKLELVDDYFVSRAP